MLRARFMDRGSGTMNLWRSLTTIKPACWIGLLSIVLVDTLSARAAQRPPSSATLRTVPEFSIPGGVYTNRVVVRLTAPSPSGVVRYTLDGAEPTSASPKYTAPIEISESTVLRAKSFDSPAPNSATVSQTYFFADPDLAGFDSNLPLVVIDSFGQPIPHEQKVYVSARFIDAREGRSTLTGPADYAGFGELNIRGNTSLRYPKHSYHFKTMDDEHRPLKVALLGFPKECDWVLYAPYPDKTLMRDVLGYELSNKIGRYASRTRFVEVFLNESGRRLGSRNYLGVYVLEEKIKLGKNRVDIEKLGPKDNAEPDISGGYIIKKDHTDRADMNEGFMATLTRSFSAKPQRFESSQGNLFFYVEPKSEEITAEQKTWLKRYVNSFERVLYGDNFKDSKTGYATYIDPASFIDHHLLVELTKNIDGFRFSTFYYKDRGGKLNMGPIWDWNLSFGNANARDGWIPEGWYWPQLDDRQYSWFRRLFEDPDFEQRYVDRWNELRTNQFSVANICARIDQLAELLGEAQTRNFQRWPVLGRNVWPNTYVGKTFNAEIGWMKQWIQNRIAWIDQQFIPAPSFSLPAGSVNPASKLELRAPAGKIYYTLDGSDPRVAGGAVSPAARVYSSALVLNEPAVVFCRVHEDRRWSGPAVAKFLLKVKGSDR